MRIRRHRDPEAGDRFAACLISSDIIFSACLSVVRMLCSFAFLFGMSALVLMPDIVYSAPFLFSQRSQPEGIIDEQTVVESGSVVSTVQADESYSGYCFAYWVLNGMEQRDSSGIALNPVSFQFLAPAVATAVYLPESQDANNNGLPDWWELRYSKTALVDGGEDTDADGFVNTNEFWRGYAPIFADRIADGGFSWSAGGDALVVMNTNFATFQAISDPAGFIDYSITTNCGSLVQLPVVPQTSSGCRFAYWSLDGIPLTDTTGRALAEGEILLSSNRLAVAHYLTEGEDLDGDSVADWYELHYTQTTNANPVADEDGDGFTLYNEFERDWHPGMRDRVMDGGFRICSSADRVVLVDTNRVLCTFSSVPSGLIDGTIVTNRGATITLSADMSDNGGLAFAYWEINGVRQGDVTDRSLVTVAVQALSNLNVVAVYSAVTEDVDGDGVPDWYEMHYLGGTQGSGDADADGDGFSMVEEGERDYHPGVYDRIEDGGFRFCCSPDVSVVLDNDRCAYEYVSVPPGLYDFNGVTNRYAVVLSPEAPMEWGGSRFVGWSVNGISQTNRFGRAAVTLSYVLASNVVIEASYLPEHQDADSDGVEDWYELHHLGNLSEDAGTNSDGDSFSLVEEFQRDYCPSLADRIVDGGFRFGSSSSVTVDLRIFKRVENVLLDGQYDPFFSTDTSSTGTIVFANSHPALGDWDGDGDLDLFVGGSNGVMRVFENNGTPKVINWVERTSEFAALAGCWTNVLNPAPSLGDWNGDGLADLAVGGGTGTVWLVASPGSWEGDNLTVELQTNFNTGAESAVPAFADINDDGWSDLLVLTETGAVWCFIHTQSASVPYASPPYTTDLLGMPVPNARGISAADVNGDGVTDILISDENGNVWEFHGNGL